MPHHVEKYFPGNSRKYPTPWGNWRWSWWILPHTPILSLHCKGKFSTYKECKHLLNERIYSCLKKFISSKNISTDLNNSKMESTNTCQHQLLPYWVIVCGEMYPEALAGTMAAFSDKNESRRDVARGGFQGFWNLPFGLWKWILSQEEKRIGTPL